METQRKIPIGNYWFVVVRAFVQIKKKKLRKYMSMFFFG